MLLTYIVDIDLTLSNILLLYDMTYSNKYQKNLEHLSPIVEALRQKVKRSYYVTYVLKHALDAHLFIQILHHSDGYYQKVPLLQLQLRRLQPQLQSSVSQLPQK